MHKYHTIIIGAGNAGFGVSSVLAEAGVSMAIIEQAEFGGTCPNRGCTPKKILVAAAKSLDEISKAEQHGIKVSKPKLDWKKLIERKDKMIDFIPNAMQDLANKRADTYIGSAKFVDPQTVEVNGELLSAENIVIATGSKTRPLPIAGAEYMISSDEVLSQTQQPKEIVFIGGGVIALEFSHVYARAGSKVTILEVMPQLLPRADKDAVEALSKLTQELGVTIKTSVKVNQVTLEDGVKKVHIEHEGESLVLEAEQVVNGAGRIANVDSLNLSAANIEHDGIRIAINQHLQSTSNPKIWVAGDSLVTSAQLSPVATAEGKLVGQNILADKPSELDLSILPSAVYTIPAFSSVGLTESEAEKAYSNISVHSNTMTEWFSSKTHLESLAWAKIIINQDNDQIIGAHLIGHHGEELINLLAMAMRYQISANQLKEDIYAYPTYASDIKNLW